MVSDSPDRSEYGWALLPLRLFLGGTFVFAGLQKLANPRFFDASSSSSIQAQIKTWAPGSPIHALLSAAGHVPVVVGVLLALGELAVGLGALVGLWARVAAVGGMVISATLFLTVSFHSSPYYLGSDIVFLFAWTPLALAGAGGVLSLDGLRRRRPPAHSSTEGPDGESGATNQAAGHDMDRRRFLAGAGLTAVAGMASAALASGLGRLHGPTTASGGRIGSAGGTGSGSPSPVAIAESSSVPMGQAVPFSAPGTGDPAWLLQPRPGRFVAFDAVCPHAHCRVNFDAAADEFVCPCHGSRFDGSTGAVLNGPALTGLSAIPVSEGPKGRLYAR